MKWFWLWWLPLTLFAQSQNGVHVTQLHAKVIPNAQDKTISGEVTFQLTLKQLPDTLFIDAIQMKVANVTANGKPVAFTNTGKKIGFYQGFKKGKNTLRFSYEAQPKQTLYFIGEGEALQIWTQGQGKYTSHWLPSFDNVNEKLIFHISVGVDPNQTALSNGLLQGKTNESGKVFWHYQMQQPMSSYLVMLAIGDFVKQEAKTTSGTPLEYYLDRPDASLFETTYKHTVALFDFMEKEIGIPYPWKLYRQVPVRDFLYSGMENTSSTIFAQDFVVDDIGYNDKTYTNVNAHELAHQWFGNLVTAQSGTHHWLQEGFATYYALLAERHLFGDDYFYLELYEMAERLQRAAKTDTIPLLNEKASSLTFYQKGAWAVHVLREQMGKDAFQKAVKNFLKKYAYAAATTDQFLAEVQKVSKVDTQKFKREWLETPGFRIQEALGYLKKNGVVARYLELIEWQEVPFEEKSDRLAALLHANSPEIIQQEVLDQLIDVPYEQKRALLLRAFRTGSLKVRQTLAQTVTELPEEILPFYESLLNDASYITREIAQGTLWRVQPDNRTEYLNRSKDWVGFHDKNLRILWLTLALITPDYENEQKVYFYDELISYASSSYPSAVRQNALTNLLYLNPNDQNVLKHLVNATTHHKWQFTLFARNQLRELIKSEPHKKFLKELLPELLPEEQRNLKRLLEAN